MRSLFPLLALCFALSAAEPPKLRLTDEIRPVQYAAELTLVPGATTTAVRFDIDTSPASPACLIRLNAS